MKAVTKILLGGAGLAAMFAAAPAAAQYGYPGGSYGNYPGYGYGGNSGMVGAILNQILGGRGYSYNVNERQAVEQCVRAVEHRINTRGFDNEGGRYRQYGYGYGYNNGYANNYMGARVVAVTQVSRRANGGLKIIGVANSGNDSRGSYGNYGYNNGYNNGYGYDNRYGYNNGYGYGYQQQADARFDCTVDRYGRITDIDANRNYASNYPYRGY